MIVADCAEPKSIEEIRRLGVPRIRPSRKGPDSLLHGIQWLNQQELVISEDCPSTWTEIEQYAWQKDEKTGEYRNRPIDAFNHCLDALRYGLEREIRSAGARGGILQRGDGRRPLGPGSAWKLERIAIVRALAAPLRIFLFVKMPEMWYNTSDLLPACTAVIQE